MLSRRIAIGAAALALVLVSIAPAADTGGGTIYYRYQNLTWTMNSDGTAKTQLPAAVGNYGVASRELHGGHRWFLATLPIAGETYPNGQPRHEIFAVRDDGDASFTVQLTNQSDLERNGATPYRVAWKPGDDQISMIARRWSGGEVVEGGVYVADILFDGNGNVTGLASQPGAPAISTGLVTWPANEVPFKGGLGPDMRNVDWAPSGTEIVHDRVSAAGLRIADTSGGGRLLLSEGICPAWSPDGTWIAFNSTGGISRIKPDGTGVKVIIKRGSSYAVMNPDWSPTGSHLVYRRQKTTWPLEDDVYRAKADGKEQTNLTGDIGGFATPFVWR
jgi:hypothetical protein